MVFSNKEGVKKLRMVLLISGACCFMTLAVLGFMAMFTALVILAGLFVIVVLFIALLNFQYVEIAGERNKLIVRYYSIFALERSFETFEFPVTQLWNVTVSRHLLGLKWDVRFTVRVQKGLADYPLVSLSAIPFRERSMLVNELRKLVLQK